jgi:hypothetical protein
MPKLKKGKILSKRCLNGKVTTIVGNIFKLKETCK